MYGTCTACVWHVHGMRVACAWHAYGMRRPRRLDRPQATEELAVYVAQLNLLKLPPLLKQV